MSTTMERVTPQDLRYITEPLPAYTGENAIISPSNAVRIMRAGEGDVLPRDGNTGVSLFGAIEIQYINLTDTCRRRISQHHQSDCRRRNAEDGVFLV